MLTRRRILWITAVSALIIRGIFASFFASTPFVSYHLVPGLDMQTLLRFSEWTGERSFPAFFTFHRLLLFVIWFINGQNHCVWAVFAVQALAGCAGCMATADIIRKFTGSRKAALTGGLLSAVYLPLLVYEFSILQETFMVNFALLAFWSMLHALHKRFTIGSGILTAAAFFAALAGRPAAVFWCGILAVIAILRMRQLRMLKRLLLPGAFLALLLFSAALFNRCNYGIFSPFYFVLPYTLQYNLSPESTETATGDDVTVSGVWQSGIKALSRIPRLFKHGELPENQNVYFWEEHNLFFLLLPGSGILIPCAAAGIMVLLLSGAWKTRYRMFLWPLIALALPLCAREPIGRYRLMLVPYFFIITLSAVVIYCRLKTVPKRVVALLGAAFGAAFALHGGEVPQRIRPSDYHARAIALENGGTVSPEAVLSDYFLYWQAENFASVRAFRVMMDKALACRNIEIALNVALQAESAGKINPDLIEYYRAWCYALLEDPVKVAGYLQKIRNVRSLPPDACEKAFMLRNRTLEILKRNRK